VKLISERFLDVFLADPVDDHNQTSKEKAATLVTLMLVQPRR